MLPVAPQTQHTASSRLQKLAADKMRCPSIPQKLCDEMTACLEKDTNALTTNDIGFNRSHLRKCVYSVLHKVLGKQLHKHQDWVDENNNTIHTLLDDLYIKHDAWLSKLTDVSNASDYQCVRNKDRKRSVQREIHVGRQQPKISSYQPTIVTSNRFTLHLNKCLDLRQAALLHFAMFDVVVLLTQKNDVLRCWAEHFQSVLKRSSFISSEAIESIPQLPVCCEMCKVPKNDEIFGAIQEMSNNKAADADKIPAEFYKYGGQLLVSKIEDLIRDCWRQETVSQDFKDADVVHLHKKKRDKSDCNNHRGISLLSVAGKIMARVLLN